MVWTNAVHRLKRRNSAVVFDAGATGIRAVQTSGTPRQPVVRDALHIPASAQESDVLASPDEVAPRAARMIGQGCFVGRAVGLVLSPPAVSFHAMQLPANLFEQHERTIREALAWEVSKESRDEVGELEVRYWRLPPGHRQRLNVMAVTMSSAAAAGWVHAFSQRGLTLRSIDVSPCALLQIAIHAGQSDPEKLWGILDLGQRAAHLSVMLGDTPVYIRTLHFSGHELSQRVARAFDVSLEQAESLKREHGMGALDNFVDPRSTGWGNTRQADVRAILSRVLGNAVDSLVGEIGLCFSYVSQNYVNREVGRVLLAGGGAELNGLESHLCEKLGLRVERLATGVVAGRSSPVNAAASLGGALRNLEAA